MLCISTTTFNFLINYIYVCVYVNDINYTYDSINIYAYMKLFYTFLAGVSFSVLQQYNSTQIYLLCWIYGVKRDAVKETYELQNI